MKNIRIFAPSAELDDVVNHLKAENVLKLGKDSTTRKIAGSTLRFYTIKLSKLS